MHHQILGPNNCESVRQINPEIIYVHCVGFGQDGPFADLQADDDVIQAASGTATLLQRVDGNPRARYLPSLIADKVAGLQAAHAVLAAVIHKMRTGRGQLVEVPMFEAFTNFMLVEHLAGNTFDPPHGTVCYSRQIDPDRQPFPTKDGYISIVAYTDPAWPAVFEVLGNPSLLADRECAFPSYATINSLFGESGFPVPRAENSGAIPGILRVLLRSCAAKARRIC